MRMYLIYTFFMTERDLLNIITAYDEGSFLAASEKLFVSQSAMSQAIRKLEKQIGARLFVCSGNRVIPTEICRKIVTRGRVLLKDWDFFQADVSHFLSENQSGITVVASNSLLLSIIFKASDLFHESNPDIKINLIEKMKQQIPEYLETGAADLGFMISRTLNPHLRMIPVLKTSYCLAVPKNHPFSLSHPVQMQTVNLQDFRDEPFVVPIRTHVSYEAFMNVFEKAGFAPRVFMESYTLANLQGYVRNGKALTLVETHYSMNMDKKDVNYYRLSLKGIDQIIYACQSLDAQPSAAVNAFINVVKGFQTKI